jgi:aromatic ring-opening dioxygenase catalytic subunit (LigB family)
MKEKTAGTSGSVLYFSHGGGPLPILGDKGHRKMVSFLEDLGQKIQMPEAIIVFSAHWEESLPAILGKEKPGLFYDYYGFPEEAYSIDYDLPGNPELSLRIKNLFADKNIPSKIDEERGFDHGVFIPLKIMYPQGNIPTTQVSLIKGLDPSAHIQLGAALKELLKENVLIIGSGFSFHNMQKFLWGSEYQADDKNDAFQNALIRICTEKSSPETMKDHLINWKDLPSARYCHPREEHLIPLHVCWGLSERPGKLIFDDYILGKRSIAILW